MVITCINGDILNTYLLPSKVSGQYWMGELVSVEADGGRWYLRSNGKAVLTDTDGRRLERSLMEPGRFYSLQTPGGGQAYLYTEELTADRQQYKKYRTIKAGILRIGRSDQNDIIYSSGYASGIHAQIEIDNGTYVVSDMRSGNGTFVNDRRVTRQRLYPGDVIYIAGLKIIVGCGILAVNNPGGMVKCSEKMLIPYLQPPVREQRERNILDNGRAREQLFYKSPRFRREIEKAGIRIDSPPPREQGNEMPMIYTVGPSMTMGLASMFMGVFAVSNALSSGSGISSALPSIVMSVSMLGGTVAWPILSRKYDKKRKIEKEEERKEKYRMYLMEVRSRIQQIEYYQRKILNENYVTLDECITRIQGRERTLWERSFGHSDFLTVRLGRGEVPLQVTLEYQEPKFEVEEDELQREMEELVYETRIMGEVPVGLSLYDNFLTGIIGRRQEECSFIKGLIFQIAALHSYDEVKMVFLYDEAEDMQWHFVKWLPHVWSDDGDIRFVATNPGEEKEISIYLEKQLALRQAEEGKQENLPYYLIFSMDKELAENMEIIGQILKLKENMGFGMVALYDQIGSLPKECGTVLDVGSELSRMYRQDDISGEYINFCPDAFAEPDCGRLAVTLANIRLYRDNRNRQLPDMISFLDMFRAGKAEHLNALTRWKENDPTLTLETEIGVDAAGNPFKLDLHEKFHGPHGLVAGMTGSGKSEFIMTYILSLAVNYHPYEVAFILIDYKGGGMAKAFEKLPHTAGIITNLDGAMVNRSLISIESELKRRQAVFQEVSKQINISNIDIYKYQKLYRDKVVHEPMQHLFIISDEFAELKEQQPEFMKQLISAARIGRSLGVHLILATQKPAGVVDDQIWSNSRFRICLKVQEKADSMDMLKRPDAAELTKTGRFYLQVGYNEIFELGQSAWSGASYVPKDKVEEKQDMSVQVIDRTGRIVKQKAPDERRIAATEDKQLDAVTKYLAALAKEEHIKIKQLWMEPLPEKLSLDSLRKKYGLEVGIRREDGNFCLEPLVGEIDDPQNQAQYPMKLPLSAEGNTIIYGATGSGKTMLLTTMIYSLIQDHTPDELNLYILDFGSEVLKGFAQAPQVGDVVLISESEKVANMFSMLRKELESRKKMMAACGGSFDSFIRGSEEKRPAIVIIIQNFAAFTESYEDYVQETAGLAMDGSRYGIYFVLTAANASGVRYRVAQNFPSVYALQLNDETDYSIVLGNVGRQYPGKVTGRGIFRNERVYEFQTAAVTEGAGGMDEVRAECTRQEREWLSAEGRRRAERIPILPEKVDLAFLQDDIDAGSWLSYPAGVDKNSLKVRCFNLEPHMVNVVTYQEESCSFVESFCRLAAVCKKADIIVLNAKPEFSSASKEGLMYCSGEKELVKGAEYIYQELLKRNNDTKDAWEEGKEAPAYRKLLCIVNGYRDFVRCLPEEFLEKWNAMMERIADFWGCRFIIADGSLSLGSISAENWYGKQVGRNEGVFVGNGLTDQYELSVTRLTRELRQEIPDDFGYVVEKGRAHLVKLLDLEEEE